MIELEKTYLAKEIPHGLKDYKSKEIIDIYIPKSKDHPKLRIRKNGDNYEMTKKEPVNEDDSSRQEEQTIILTETEFNELSKIEGKRVHKIRYYYNHTGNIAEIDVFQGALKGLIIVDFEFKTLEEKDSFEMPAFCLIEITQELFIAGGMICGKSYEDIEENLKKFNYAKLYLG
tara:strand:+ start:9758 stop:10279 length:522 start_codon:yes stop_codon:yes gene_type:complete